jgi:hypothetical protein
MPGYRRHFSSSRYKSQSHSRTKRGWFCLVPSKLDSRSVQCSTTAGLCVVPGNQPQPSNVIAGISRRGTRPGSVWIQCASAPCPHNARQRYWRLSAGLCWRQRTATLNTNDVLQYRKRVNALTTTMFEAQPIIVMPWHPDTAQRHTARGGHWARAAKPRRCQHEATPTVHRADCGINRGTAAHKTGLALYTLALRAWRTDTTPPQPPALGRHRAQSHSRTKRAWFCLVPSKPDPRSAPGSASVGLCVVPVAQSQPSSVILGSPRCWTRPISVMTYSAPAHRLYNARQRRWSPGVERCYSPGAAASHPDNAAHCSNQDTVASATVFQAPSPIVAPRPRSASHRHNARGWQGAHTARSHRNPNKRTAAHKTAFTPHVSRFSTRKTDTARSQPPTLSRHRARSHSRTKRAWFCFMLSKLDLRSAPCSILAGHCVTLGIQQQPSSVILGNTQRWAWAASVAARCAFAQHLHTTRQHCWSPSVGLCWSQCAAALSVNYVQQHPKRESTSSTTMLQAQSSIVAPRQPRALLRHNARGWQWAHKAGPYHCQHSVTPIVYLAHHCPNKGTAAPATVFQAQSPIVAPLYPNASRGHNTRGWQRAHKAGPHHRQHEVAPSARRTHHCSNKRNAPRILRFRTRQTATAQPRPPTLGQHRARSHSRTKRAWFCLVPSKLDPQSARCSILADHCVTPGIQPQPSSVIPGSTRRWTRPASVAARCAFAHCLHTTRQRCWSQCTAASNPDYALHCPKGESASPTTLCGAQSTIVAPRQPSAAPRYGTRSWQWAHKGKLHRCQSEATLIVHPESQCPKKESTSITTLCGAQSLIVASRQPSAAPRYGTRGWQWAHKAKPRSRQSEATLIVHPESQCPKKESASPTTVCGVQSIIVAPRHNARDWQWAYKGKPRRCHHEATLIVRRESQCPKGESASITTLCGAQSTIVAPRHNARDWQWAHKGKPRRCQHGAAPTVRAAQRCLNRGTAAHKTGLAPHTFQLRARGTDTVLPQPPALGRQRAQSHSRTKKVSCARCNPGYFPGQTALDHHCPSLATTTVSLWHPRQTNVAHWQHTTPETGDFTLTQRGILTLGSPVRALHSLAMTRDWPGTPWFNAAVTRCKPRPPTVRPMIFTIVGAPFQRSTNQATYSVGPGQQPWSPPRQIADVPPRRSVVVCPASRTGNLYTVPVIRCIPETLTKVPHRDACRVAPIVCAVPRARHGARLTLAERWQPVIAQSTTACLAPFYTGEAAQ